MRTTAWAMAVFVAGLAGCSNATVDVTKTVKGFYAPTRADDIEILVTRPTAEYIEMGTISTTDWEPSETAKMHNAMRSKTAPLGADAVIVTDSGIIRRGGRNVLWTSGVAIRYKDKAR